MGPVWDSAPKKQPSAEPNLSATLLASALDYFRRAHGRASRGWLHGRSGGVVGAAIPSGDEHVGYDAKVGTWKPP